MIKKISAFIFNDIGWKILALLLAIALYFFVMNWVNPTLRKSYYKQIQYVGRDLMENRGFIILNEMDLPLGVTLSIEAKQQDLNNLVVITPTVDLSEIDDSYNNLLGQYIKLPVRVNLSQLYTIKSRDPENVSIKIDKMGSEPRPVMINLTGSVKEGYQNMPAIYQDTVMVTAPESILRTISGVSASVDIKNADRDVTANQANLYVYDMDNKDITNLVKLSVNQIQIQVPVYPIKKVPIRALVAGDPAPGYWGSEISVAPDTVDLVGPADALGEINEIVLGPVQLNGLTASTTSVFDIWEYLKDPHLSIRNDSASTVTVTVKIDKEATKRLDLLMDKGHISVITDVIDLQYSLPLDPISVTIQGPADAISDITSDNLHAELDLSGLSSGIHDVPAHLEVPHTVSYQVKVRVVIHGPSAPTPAPSAADTENPDSASTPEPSAADTENPDSAPTPEPSAADTEN